MWLSKSCHSTLSGSKVNSNFQLKPFLFHPSWIFWIDITAEFFCSSIHMVPLKFQVLDQDCQYLSKINFITLGLCFSAWIWISTTACSWYEACWTSYAKFLCANCPAGAARSASRRQTCWSCTYATNSSASSPDAAAGNYHFVFLQFVMLYWFVHLG